MSLHCLQYIISVATYMYMCMCMCMYKNMLCCSQENLLDRHEFLKWLVEEEFTKATDHKVLQLYLPLVLTVSTKLMLPP